MKKLAFAVALALIALLMAPAVCAEVAAELVVAQDDQDMPNMADRGMGRGMMGACPVMDGHCPLCKFMMMMRISPAQWLLNHQQALNLNDDQVQRLQQMDNDYSMQQIDRKANIEKKLVGLRQLLESEQVDPAELNARLNEVSAVAVEMITAWFTAKQQAVGVLTPEQQQKARAMLGMRRGQQQPGKGQPAPKRGEGGAKE